MCFGVPRHMESVLNGRAEGSGVEQEDSWLTVRERREKSKIYRVCVPVAFGHRSLHYLARLCAILFA